MSYSEKQTKIEDLRKQLHDTSENQRVLPEELPGDDFCLLKFYA